MILAGDIGGTHARLAFFDATDGKFRLHSSSVFPSREYAGLDEIVARFAASSSVHADSACFGIAGPVRNGRVEASNLPWVVEGKRLAEELHLDHALLINDLEANAWGISTLEPGDVVALQACFGDVGPLTRLGETVKEPRLRIAGANGEWIVWAQLADLKEAWQKPLRW